ncbi:MAG: hypothetical protein JWN69_1581, partial [Alphaproteobacteria bacterium]|nr:hypothetical protein [Alphaproteobacteria bacterium]
MLRSKVQLLAAGVSILAINAAAPVLAAVEHRQDQGKYQNGTTNIYDVPDPAFPADPGPPPVGPDTHGEIFIDHAGAAAAGNADATVSTDTGATPANNPGEIHQDAFGGASPSNTINVNSLLTIHAVADATGSIAEADAIFNNGANGIAQHAGASTAGSANNDLNVATDTAIATANAGIDIIARASAQATVGNASADASITQGAVEQQIFSGATGRNEVQNDGVINIFVDADAVSDNGNAAATANLDGYGVGQYVVADHAENAVLNSNTHEINVNVTANATADEGVANAQASLEIGVGQWAIGSSFANGTIDNSGEINVTAAAVAHGNEAIASATMGFGSGTGLNRE